MDISVAVTRTGIFVAVYSMVLGIPYALAFGLKLQLTRLLGDLWWILPLITLTLLATAGPFAYLYIQRKAEKRLFEEQLRYQTTLRQASYGMGRIKNLKRLVNYIVEIILKNVEAKHCEIYIYDKHEKKYLRHRADDFGAETGSAEKVGQDSAVIEELLRQGGPVLCEGRSEDGQIDAALYEKIKALKAAVVVPSFINQELIAFITLGEKKSKAPYSDEDMVVFSVLAGQAAMAIENAQYYDDLKRTHEQLFQAEKLAYVGQLASSVVHEIRNPLTAIKTFIESIPAKY
ncbi:MAG: GAF domain-containing protein, partial [Candidatus Omnitrophota bacterium]